MSAVPNGVEGETEGQLFTGRRDATDVGKQGVVLQPGQGLFQWLGRVEVVDDHPKAPQIRRFGADQLKHQLQRGRNEEKQEKVAFSSVST